MEKEGRRRWENKTEGEKRKQKW